VTCEAPDSQLESRQPEEKATFWCNGKQAWEATGLKPTKGNTGLQAKGAALGFRNFRLHEFARLG